MFKVTGKSTGSVGVLTHIVSVSGVTDPEYFCTMAVDDTTLNMHMCHALSPWYL